MLGFSGVYRVFRESEADQAEVRKVGWSGPMAQVTLLDQKTNPRPQLSSGVAAQLKTVQKVRFVELCRQYGWLDEERSSWRMPFLRRWAPDDQAEMRALLDEAAKPPSSLATCSYIKTPHDLTKQ